MRKRGPGALDSSSKGLTGAGRQAGPEGRSQTVSQAVSEMMSQAVSQMESQTVSVMVSRILSQTVAQTEAQIHSCTFHSFLLNGFSVLFGHSSKVVGQTYGNNLCLQMNFKLREFSGRPIICTMGTIRQHPPEGNSGPLAEFACTSSQTLQAASVFTVIRSLYRIPDASVQCFSHGRCF